MQDNTRLSTAVNGHAGEQHDKDALQGAQGDGIHGDTLQEAGENPLSLDPR